MIRYHCIRCHCYLWKPLWFNLVVTWIADLMAFSIHADYITPIDRQTDKPCNDTSEQNAFQTSWDKLTPVFDLVWESLGGFPAKGLLTNQKIEHDWRTSLRQTTRVFVWPWPWPSDPDTWPWRRYSYDVNVCQKWSFVRLWFRRDYLNPLKCSDVR